MAELNNSVITLQAYQSALFAVLSFILFFRHGNYSKKFLGWFMVLSTVYALSKASCSHPVFALFPFLCPPGVTLLLSFFPLFYFYIKSLIIPGYRFRNRELLRLAPALILFLLILPTYFGMNGQRAEFAAMSSGQPDHSWPVMLRYAWYAGIYGYFNVQVVIYSVRVANLYRLHKSNLAKSFSDTTSINLAWVVTLMLLFLLFLFVLGISLFLGLNRDDLFHNVINLLELLIILVFAIFAILQQDIYPEQEPVYIEQDRICESPSAVIEHEHPGRDDGTGTIAPRLPAIIAGTGPVDEADAGRGKKYAGSGLAEGQKKALAKKLDKLMKEKFYLNAKLTLDEVAGKLETNTKYLSQVINESQQQNFYAYINTFRIREAQRLLDDRLHQKYSVHGIAHMVGFSSKSSFNEAFRRITGMTPSEYQKRK